MCLRPVQDERRRSRPGRGRSVPRAAVADLRWGELVALASDPSAAPAARRAAERHLLERLDDLALGERIALARRATRSVLRAMLGARPAPAVLRAALGNPRMTEADLVRVVDDPRTRPESLAVVGAFPGWSERLAVRLALARNARTPARTALGVLSGLPLRTLVALAADPATPGLVRIGARRTAERSRSIEPPDNE